MDKIKLIKSEIEKLKAKNRPYLWACASQVASDAIVKQDTYNEVLAIIDSLSEK